MKKQTKTKFCCDYCCRTFSNPKDCEKHEIQCKVIFDDENRLQNYLFTLLNHYHRKGYKIDIRFSDYYETGLDVALRK